MDNERTTEHADISFDIAATFEVIMAHPQALWVIAIIAATVIVWKWLDQMGKQ